MNSVARVVIVGGGFAGLNAARTLAKGPVDIVPVDRVNYHLFQPCCTRSLQPFRLRPQTVPANRVATFATACDGGGTWLAG